MAKTVKMQCGDKTADVHPDEVKNMEAAGWSKVEAPKRKATK